MEAIKRIHHISAIVGHPQENLNFYRDVLGLRLIKKTVNFDDPNVYHLYFSDDNVTPATILTFFPWVNAHRGRVGSGQVGTIAFRIPKGSMDHWKTYLENKGVEVEESELFNKSTIEFEDVHGLDLALVESKEESEKQDILGFHGVVLLSSSPNETQVMLTKELGLTGITGSEHSHHVETIGEEKHHIVIPRDPLPSGRWGVGTVHHIAWSVPNDRAQKDWKETLKDLGYNVTEVKNRNYFNAIYLREKGEIIFEFATDGPGFAIDESKEALGQKLMLPPQYEDNRKQIEEGLPKLD